MSTIQYQKFKFKSETLALIEQANEIIEDYEAQGFSLTLRQLYYQFVSRDLLGNTQRNYKRLGSVINDARLAGMVDWSSIVDRTRNLRSLSNWEGPEDIISDCVDWYREDLWASQDNYVEVWIEKDALIGVIEGVCEDNLVPFFSCRGYTSQSEMHGAAIRMINQFRDGKRVHVIHLGDHDPSGIDMSRDITDRIELFMMRHSALPAEIHRIALNMDQVDEYSPPPNPAKLTDSRATSYVDKFGLESWELDALEPAVMADLIQDKIDSLKDQEMWDDAVDHERESKAKLTKISEDLE